MPEDQKLTRAVAKALAENEATKALEHLHVRAVGGVVFLEGEVASAEERDAVMAAIKAVEGVRFVRNRLQVNPEGRGGGWREAHRHEQ